MLDVKQDITFPLECRLTEICVLSQFILAFFIHTPYILALGMKDAVALAGAASGKTNSIPIRTAAVCLPHLPQASYFEHVRPEQSFLPVLCQMLQHPWDGSSLLTCKMMRYL